MVCLSVHPSALGPKPGSILATGISLGEALPFSGGGLRVCVVGWFGYVGAVENFEWREPVLGAAAHVVAPQGHDGTIKKSIILKSIYIEKNKAFENLKKMKFIFIFRIVKFEL